MDILAVLAASPARGVHKCPIQRWIDDIPEDAPGRDDLVAAAESADRRDPHHRTRTEMLGIFARLGLTTSESTIGDHRNKRCRCYW